MQQLQRNTAIPPAQVSIEELKATNPSDAQQTLLPNEREGIPAKEVEQRIECVPLERIVTEQYQRILNMRNVAGIVKNFDPAKLGVLVSATGRTGHMPCWMASIAWPRCGGWAMTPQTVLCWKA